MGTSQHWIFLYDDLSSSIVSECFAHINSMVAANLSALLVLESSVPAVDSLKH